MDVIVSAVQDVASSGSQIQQAMLTILGVLVTIGIAWAIVSGVRR